MQVMTYETGRWRLKITKIDIPIEKNFTHLLIGSV